MAFGGQSRRSRSLAVASGAQKRLARVQVGDLLKERTPSDIAFRLLWSEGISPFHGEARFADLRGICRGNTGELRADVIDDV